jgi:hypothetical protein
MGSGEALSPYSDSGSGGPEAAVSERGRYESAPGWVIETVVSPFHCLYQDALEFHKQSQLRVSRSEAEASRLARAALVLYLDSASALIHQAAVELGRPEAASLVADPDRPLAPAETWRLLPAFIAEAPPVAFDPEQPPWPQFLELLMVRASWAYPGPPAQRRAYYRSPQRDASYEPLQPHQIPPGLGLTPDQLHFPKTGLPRDPYALRPHHLDTARGILDAAIEALDRRLGGTLTRDGRHRREPVRLVHPPAAGRPSAGRLNGESPRPAPPRLNRDAHGYGGP